MSIFNKKKDEKEEKKSQVKEAKVDDVKKAVKTDSKEKKSMKDLYDGGETEKKSTGKNKTTSTSKFDQAYKVLVKPLITEKGAKLGAENKYAFVVDVNANKISVSKAVDQVYGIKPIKVNIVNIKGKKVKSRRQTGKRKDWRKAIVTLPKGKSINIYEGV